MSSAPQIQTQEISDADLDNVSGGVFAGLAGQASIEAPLPSISGGISTAAGADVLGVAGVGSTSTVSF